MIRIVALAYGALRVIVDIRHAYQSNLAKLVITIMHAIGDYIALLDFVNILRELLMLIVTVTSIATLDCVLKI